MELQSKRRQMVRHTRTKKFKGKEKDGLTLIF